MSYAFSGNHRLDVAYTGKWDKSDSDNRTTGSSMSETHSDSHVYLHNIDLNYALPFGLNISGSYTRYRTPRQQVLNGTMTTSADTSVVERDLTGSSRQTIDKWMFAADQNHSLEHGWGLSYGVKAQYSSNNSNQTTLDNEGNILPEATGSVDINERIWNVYAGFSKQVTQSLSLEASVAAEHYNSPLWNEWKVYPSLNALWRVNDNNTLNLSFSSDSE